MAVTIEYNIVNAHYKIDELRNEVDRLTNQRDAYLEGLRDYAEADWWKQDNPAKSLEKHVDDAVKDYTLDSSS
jgi:hypothetical protein